MSLVGQCKQRTLNASCLAIRVQLGILNQPATTKYENMVASVSCKSECGWMSSIVLVKPCFQKQTKINKTDSFPGCNL